MSTKEKQTEGKRLIQRIHQQQLKSGIRNDTHEPEMVQILGGIDQILSVFFQPGSNIPITQKQIDNIYEILNAPNKRQPKKPKICVHINNVEDKGMDQNIEYNFHDSDTFIFSLFERKTASSILKWIQSRIAITVLIMIMFVGVVLFYLTNYALSKDIFWIYWSTANIICVIYIILWLLYTNKIALKLVITQFEFHFKNLYLIQWLIVNIALTRRGIYSPPLYWQMTYHMLMIVFLLWVKLFDAVNIRRENKLIISCVAAGFFLLSALEDLRVSVFRDKYTLYPSTIISVSIWGSSDIKISLIDISYHSAAILSIFMFRQILLLIISPTKCLLIRKRPIVNHENIDNTVSKITQKQVKNCQILCLLYWCFICLLCIFNSITASTTVLYVYWISLSSLTIVIICCITSLKCSYVSTIIILIFSIIYCIGTFVLHLFVGGIVLALLGFGIAINYLLKAIDFNKLEHSSSNVASTKEKRIDNDTMILHTKNYVRVDVVAPNQIEMKKIMKKKQSSSFSSSDNSFD